jgi:hypothetical protein
MKHLMRFFPCAVAASAFFLSSCATTELTIYTVVPIDELPDKEIVKEKIGKLGAASVIVTRLVDRKTRGEKLVWSAWSKKLFNTRKGMS